MNNQRFITNTDEISKDVVYKGMLDAIRSNVAEAGFVISDGDEIHYTSIPLMRFYELLEQVAESFATEFNTALNVTEECNRNN